MIKHKRLNGIILRNSCKQNLTDNPPVPGEMVFALDTGEHGWLDEKGILTWVKLNSNNQLKANIVFKGETIPSNTLGTNGDKYIQYNSSPIINYYKQNLQLIYSIPNNGPSVVLVEDPNLEKIGISSGDEIFSIFSITNNDSIVDGKNYIDFSITLKLKSTKTPVNLNLNIDGIDIVIPDGLYDSSTGIYKAEFKGYERDFYGYSNFVQLYMLVKNINKPVIDYLNTGNSIGVNSIINIIPFSIIRNKLDNQPYTEWSKINNIWKKQILKRVVFEKPNEEDFTSDPNGTVYYVLGSL